MIRYLSHDQIEPGKWDSCIDQSFNGNVYGYSWYLDLVCPGWSALVEDDYVRVMPLPSWKKWGVSYLAQPYFTQQLGLFSQPALSPEVLEDFMDHIPDRFRYADFNLNVYNTLRNRLAETVPQDNYELDLIHPYEKIRLNYTENLKRNLKKAEMSRFSLIKGLKPEIIIDLFRMNKGASLPQLQDKQYQLLKRVIYGLISRGLCQIWAAIDENNQIAAGIIWAYSHQKAIFLFSALSEDGKAKGVMPWMIDTFIRERAGSSITLDFEGSNDENLARFYASFGSRKTSYLRYRHNTLPPLYNYLYRLYRKIKSRK